MTTPDYQAHNFRDGPGGGTPITAAILNDDEAAIVALHNYVNPVPRAVKTDMAELSYIQPDSATPAGRKVMVLSETWDGPGTLKQFWVAAQDSSGNAGSTASWCEQGGYVVVYADDDTTPVISLTVGEFFGYYPLCDAYNAGPIGRTIRNGGQTGAWREMSIPFDAWCRVELHNTTSGQIAPVYGRASYTLWPSTNPTRRRLGTLVSRGAVTRLTPVTVTRAGACLVESIYVHVESNNTGDAALREGNWVLLDGTDEVWSSSGSEDAVNGAWYVTPRGGYPAGEAGRSSLEDASHTGYCYYRHFPTPIPISSNGLTFKAYMGEAGEGTLGTGTVNATVHVTYSTSAAPTTHYMRPNSTVINQWPLNSLTGFTQPGDKTQFSAGPDGATVVYDSTATGQDARLTRSSYTLPTNYWAQVTVKINGAQSTDQEAYLGVEGSTSDSYYGSAVHCQLRRFASGTWDIRARDDFNDITGRRIGNGVDLVGTSIDLAIKAVGADTTMYFKNSNSTRWSTIARWTASKTAGGLSLGTWNAGATFSNLVIYGLDGP